MKPSVLSNEVRVTCEGGGVNHRLTKRPGGRFVWCLTHLTAADEMPLISRLGGGNAIETRRLSGWIGCPGGVPGWKRHRGAQEGAEGHPRQARRPRQGGRAGEGGGPGRTPAAARSEQGLQHPDRRLGGSRAEGREGYDHRVLRLTMTVLRA